MSCASEPKDVPDNGATLLLTVSFDAQSTLTGSPARLFDYQRTYSNSNTANRALRALANDYQLTALEAWPISSLGVICQVFAAPKSEIDGLLTRLESDERVESVQLMNTFETLTNHDPYRKLQSNLDQIQTTAAHKLATGDGVTIAIIDSHIDSQHPELKQTIRLQKNLTPQTRIAADDHGTAIAGIIAAKENNGVGIVGIAPESRILALTACWPVEASSASCNSFTLARALDFALSNKAQVINLSLGGPEDVLLGRLVEKAIEQGIVVIGAYDPIRAHTFPAMLRGVISVASNKHENAMLHAPGDEVLTTTPNAGYDFFSGHSFAAAHITGIVALALELEPALTPPVMSQALKQAIRINGKIDACSTLNTINSQWLCPTTEIDLTNL